MRRAALALVLATLAAAAACAGGSRDGPPAAEAAAASYFVGRAPSGVGAAVDLAGADRVALTLRGLLRGGEDRQVVVVALVNGSARAIPLPRFRAVSLDGRTTRLGEAAALARQRGAPALARRLEAGPRLIGAGRSRLLYLVLDGPARPGPVALEMRVPGDEAVDLSPRAR